MDGDGIVAKKRRTKVTFAGYSEYYKKLQELEQIANSQTAIKKAVAAGASPVADEVRARIEKLPKQKFQRLHDGEMFQGVSNSEKQELANGFGLAKMKDNNGFVHTKVGFEGYGSFPTNTYPKGVPLGLLAASIESGSSVRQKHPFIEPAVKATRKAAIAAMEKSIDQSMKEIFEGG